MSKPTEPTTPAQRRAVEVIQKFDHVFVASPGNYAPEVTPNEVSGAMSVWLQASGWAVWDLSGRAALVLNPKVTR